MEDNKLRTLYDNLIKDNYELPDFNTFQIDMSDTVKSKKLHETLVADNYDLPDYDTFTNDLGLKKKDLAISPLESASRGQTVLQDFGLPLNESITQVSPSASTEEQPKPKGTSVIGDLARSLWGSTTRALGGLAETPMLINRTVQNITMKPLMKAMGSTDEEADATLNYITGLTTLGQGAIAGEYAQKSLNKEAARVEAKMKPIEGNIVKNIQEGNWGDAGELLGRGMVQSLPYLVLTATTAGGGTPAVLTTIGATSAAQQYGELEGKPEGQKILNSWMYGGFEAAGELVTAGLLRGVGKSFRQGVTKTIEPNMVKGMAKGIAKSFGLEGSSESVTQIGQNITDIVTGVDPNKNVLSNVLDAGIIGGISGIGIGGANIGASVLGRAMASDKEVQSVQDNINQQKVLIDQIESTDNKSVKKALESRLTSLKEESNLIMDENKRIAENITPEEQSKVAELYSVQDELQAKIDKGEVTEQEVPTIEKTIEGIKGEIQTIKEDFLTAEEEALKLEEKKVDQGKTNNSTGELKVPKATKEQMSKQDIIKRSTEILLRQNEIDVELRKHRAPLIEKYGLNYSTIMPKEELAKLKPISDRLLEESRNLTGELRDLNLKNKEVNIQIEKPAKSPFTAITPENISEIEKNNLSSLKDQELTEVQDNFKLIKQSVNERAERERNPLGESSEDRTGEISIIRPEEIKGNGGSLEGIFRGRRDGNRGATTTPEEQVTNTLAPNGQKSNLSPEHHALVRTPEFKAKFGDWQKGEGSLVLDRNGEPLLVYSGKGKYHLKGLDPTKTQQKILFFTGDRLLAKDYAQFGGKQPVIYRGFVRINEGDIAEGSKIGDLHEGQQEFITTKKDQFIPVGVEEVPKIKKSKTETQGEAVTEQKQKIEKPKSWMSFISSYRRREISDSLQRMTPDELKKVRKSYEKYLQPFTPYGQSDIKAGRAKIKEIDELLDAHKQAEEYNAELKKKQEESNFDWNSLFKEPTPEEKAQSEAKQKAEDEAKLEEDYQKSSFDKKWAKTRNEAIEKTLAKIKKAEDTITDWGSRVYKKGGGSVLVGKDNDYEMRNVDVDNLNERRRRRVIEGAKQDIIDAKQDLKKLNYKDPPIDAKNTLDNYLNEWKETTLKNKNVLLKEINADYDMVLTKLRNMDLIKTDCL